MDVVDRPAPGVVLGSSLVVVSVGDPAVMAAVDPEVASAVVTAAADLEEAAARAGETAEGAAETATVARAAAPPTGR